MKIKLGPFKVCVRKQTLWCAYGPAIKGKKGQIFGLRYPMYRPARAIEQWYKMAKAKNFTEFQAAMNIRAVPIFNTIYADKYDTIYYVFNGLLPARSENYNWQRVLPGDTSATRWTEYVPYSKLPQLLNPRCGYVYNTNNSPFKATCEAENLKKENYPTNLAFEWNRENNRDHRVRELFRNRTSISFEELKAVKYDFSYPTQGPCRKTFKVLENLKADDYPDIAKAIKFIQSWDFRGNIENERAALVILAYYYMFKEKDLGFIELESGVNIEPDVAVRAIRKAQEDLLCKYGKLNVPLGQAQFLERGDRSMPLPGLPEVLGSTYTEPSKQKNHLLKAIGGDSYVAFVVFANGKLEKLETTGAYGASSDPASPHYFDQAALMSAQKNKPMTLDKQTVLRTAKRLYHPR